MKLRISNNKAVLTAAAVLAAAAALPVSQAVAGGATEAGCYDITNSWRASFKNVYSHATGGVPGTQTITYANFPDTGRVHVDLALAAESCASATYTVIVRSVFADARGSKQVFRTASVTGVSGQTVIPFDVFVDRYAGYVDGMKCVEVEVQTSDGTGPPIDVANNSDFTPVQPCKDGSGATSYSG